MTLSLSLATFCWPNSHFTFYSLQHHVHNRHRGYYDEQKAAAVVQASLPGLRRNAKLGSTRKYLRDLVTYGECGLATSKYGMCDRSTLYLKTYLKCTQPEICSFDLTTEILLLLKVLLSKSSSKMYKRPTEVAKKECMNGIFTQVC